MNVSIVRPVGITLLDWADQLVLDLGRYGVIGRLESEDEWQDWAMQLLNNTTLGRNLPNPYNFTEWKDWAERLCGALS